MGSRTGFDISHSPAFHDFRRSWLDETGRIIFFFLFGLLFLQTFVLQPASIPSRSMEDALLVGDQILVNRFLYASAAYGWEGFLPFRPPARGDVVVFRHPQEPEADYVKRIIGLPGETVIVVEGTVSIDGRPLDEPYLNPLYRDRRSSDALRVPLDHYFVMGDHRNVSSDSRSWGTVSRALLKGQATMIMVSSQPAADSRDRATVTLRSALQRGARLLFHGRWERALRQIR